MLLFLMKHSTPDIANATRELSKANDGANSAAYELLCMISYVLDMNNLDFKLELTKNASEPPITPKSEVLIDLIV